jgi:hypothetical protein
MQTGFWPPPDRFPAEITSRILDALNYVNKSTGHRPVPETPCGSQALVSGTLVSGLDVIDTVVFTLVLFKKILPP